MKCSDQYFHTVSGWYLEIKQPTLQYYWKSGILQRIKSQDLSIIDLFLYNTYTLEKRIVKVKQTSLLLNQRGQRSNKTYRIWICGLKFARLSEVVLNLLRRLRIPSVGLDWDCDLFGSTPTGNHLEERAGLDVSSTSPSIWGVSVAST